MIKFFRRSRHHTRGLILRWCVMQLHMLLFVFQAHLTSPLCIAYFFWIYRQHHRWLSPRPISSLENGSATICSFMVSLDYRLFFLLCLCGLCGLGATRASRDLRFVNRNCSSWASRGPNPELSKNVLYFALCV